jgi:hypothetical protein
MLAFMPLVLMMQRAAMLICDHHNLIMRFKHMISLYYFQHFWEKKNAHLKASSALQTINLMHRSIACCKLQHSLSILMEGLWSEKLN